MNHTTNSHSGVLVTGTGDEIEIQLELIGGRTLRMSASGDELGAWPIEECHIEPDPTHQGSFRVVVDGDDAQFTPIDPVGFRGLVNRILDDEAGAGPESHSPSVATTATAAPTVPADDPVAFLFGSSLPPPPPPQPEPDFGDWNSLEDTAPADISSPAPLGEDEELHDVEDEPVIPVATDDASSLDVFTDIDRWEDELFATDPDTDDSAGRDAENDSDLEPALAEPFAVPSETGLSEVEELRGRFGGSALDRLSAAIGSMKTHSSAHDSDSGAEGYDLGPNTVAEDVLTTQRSLRDHRLKTAARGKYLKWTGFGVGAVMVIVLFAVLTPQAISFVQNYEGDAEPPPTLPVTATTVAPTTSAVLVDTETDPPATSVPITGDGTLFDRPAPEFVATWNGTGGPIDSVLEFDSFPPLGPFEERFTPFLALTAVVQPDGTLDAFSLVVDPSGPTEYDRIGIQALGVAIATVEPERSPEGRATLLGQLGLNVRQPLLEGIDGTVETDGLVYRLVYDNATTLLTLTVSAAA